MQKTLVWPGLLLKSILHNKILYILSFSMVALVVLLTGIDVETKNVIGACVHDSYNSDTLIRLMEDNGYEIYSDRDDLVQDVTNGKLSCGFIFDEHYDDIVLGNHKGKAVYVVASAGFLYSEVEKERIVSAILYSLSDRIIEIEADNIFENSNKEIEDVLKFKKNEYLASDVLFDADIEYIEADSVLPQHKLIDKNISHIVIFLLFVSLLFCGVLRYESGYNAIIESVLMKERLVFMFSFLMSEGVVLALVCGLLLLATGNFSGLDVFFSILFTFLCSAIWIGVLVLLVKKEATYIAICPAIIVAGLIICNVFVDLSQIFEPIKYLRLIFPVIYCG